MKHRRQLREALFFEKDGDLNLSQVLMVAVVAVGIVGFCTTVIFGDTENTLVKIAAWSFLGATFASLLIGSLPLAKAKILSQSKLPSNIASAIADVADNVETSTDLQEITQRETTPDIG